uniref:HemK methyltransferase family member 1 n=1 Tax=Chrysemys picta bellii TaxID=8478 RepID=A0A8C3F9P5_CHRPI
MRLLTSPLRRMLLGLQNLCEGEGGSPAKCCVLNPHRLLRRENFSAKVTAIELVSYWRGVFEANGIPEAQESSEYIVSYVLGAKTFHSLGAGSLSTPLTLEQRQQIQQLSMKRLQRMPVQYVLGEWDFRELTLKMRPPVFIPRPETEELVSLVLEEELQRSGSPAVLIGCGSGAIALSLLSKLPKSRVIAVDKEEAAVNLTKENAQRTHTIPQGRASASETPKLDLRAPENPVFFHGLYCNHSGLSVRICSDTRQPFLKQCRVY